MENTGHILIAVLCCIWPLICSVLAVMAHRRYQRRGIDGFIPKIRLGGMHDG